MYDPGMPCPPHSFVQVPASGPKIAGFRCKNCSATFDASARVSPDGEHTHWFAGERNAAIEAVMNSGDTATNLALLEQTSPQPPLHTRWFFVGTDL
jgi:hypothetical protein